MTIGHWNPATATQTMDRIKKCADGPGQSRVVKQSPARLLRVLIIDDDCDIADTMSMVIRLWGHDVRSAYDGTTGLLQAWDIRPDVLLLDVAMSEVTGCEVAQYLRRYPRFDRTRIIAMSGYAQEAHRALCRQAGFDDFLAKPFELSTLEALLASERDRLPSPPEPASPAWLVERYSTAKLLSPHRINAIADDLAIVRQPIGGIENPMQTATATLRARSRFPRPAKSFLPA